jgi:hypothetical protein
MAEILLRSREQILGDLVRSIVANSDYSDFAPGSTMATLLEAIASVNYQNFLMVLKLLESTDLESLTGVGLDRKAGSIGLPDGTGGVGRKPASPASGFIVVTDPRYPKKSSKLYAGKPAPYSGGTVVYVEDASTWPDPSTNPKIYIGRGTASNLEGPVRYTSKTNNGVFWTLQLEGTLTKNHSISETVVLAQGGDRVISAGTTCQTTPNAATPAVSFTTDSETVILDGDDTTTITVTCTSFGESGNALAGAVNRFGTQPFPQAQVRNASTFANGRSTENDEELRQRIRDYPATLSRGTRAAITAALLGLRDPDSGKAIASVVVIEPTEPGEPSKIFINDGSLLEPTFSGQPYELFVKDASGQEMFFRTTYSPITPCVAIGANAGPYALQDLLTLTVTIDGVNEVFTVTGSNYLNLETATSLELVRDFNAQANICSFRTINGAKGIAVFDLSGKAEVMTISAGELQATLGLPTSEIKPIYLYKNGSALSFKGKTATLTTNQHPWSLTANDLRNLVVRVDKSYQSFTINDADFAPYFSNIVSATVDQWILVLKTKLSGVNFQKVGSRIVWSTFQTYTPDSYLEIMPKVSHPGVYHFVGGEIVITADADYGINSLGNYDQLITLFNASDSNLNGDYLAKISTVGGVSEIRFPSTLATTGFVSWFHNSNLDAGWIGSSKMWPVADNSAGATKDFQLNRFTGEIRLTTKPETGSVIEVGSLSTRAKIRSKTTIGGLYSIPPNIFGNSKLVLSFDDSAGVIKTLNIGVSSKLQSTAMPNKIIRLNALDGIVSDSQMFINVVAGDWIYLVNYTGSVWGVEGLFLIKQISTLTEWIEIEVDSTQYGLFTGTQDVISGSLFAFSSKVIPQVVDFGALSSVTVDQVVDTINAQIHSGKAEKLSAEAFVIRTNSYANDASINLFAAIGNANTILEATTATSVQPHVASLQTGKIDGGFAVIESINNRTIPADGYGTRGFLAVSNDYADVLDTFINPTAQEASVITTYPKGYQVAIQTGRLSNYTGRIYNTSNVAPFLGFMRGASVIRPPFPFDTAVNGGVVQNYRNISLRLRDLPITKDDKLVVEMDLNSIEKTIIIPMHKRAVIDTCSDITGGGNAYSMQFTLKDPDDANKPFFDVYSTFKTFNLNDFRVLTKSVGVYKFDTFVTAIVLRSLDVEAANRLKLMIRYPSSPDKSDVIVSHRSSFVGLTPETTLMAELSSGALVAGSLLTIGTLNVSVIPNAGTCDITFGGSLLDPTKYTVGNILKLSGGHALSGSYLITGTTITPPTVTCNAPGLMRYKTVPVTGCIAYTTSNSNVVIVNKTNHGLSSGDTVNITASAGIDGISSGDLSVSNASVVWLSADTFSYTALGTASTPPTGSGTLSFPYYNRTLTTTPGSADILVTQSAHPFVGGEGIDINSSVGIGGLNTSDLNLTNALVTYVNVNQYKYTALSAAPSNIGSIDFSRSDAGLTISTTAGSSTVIVGHASHKYLNGATLTFSSAAKPPSSTLNNTDFNGVFVITVINANSYSYSLSVTETVTSTNGTITATYGPYTASAQTGNNSSIVTMTYSVPYLDSGALVNTTATTSIGGISFVNLTRTNTVITTVSASSFTYTAGASAPAWSNTAPVRRTTQSIVLEVPQLPPPGSNSVTANLTDHRIKTGEQFYITASGAIGGMTQAALQNNGSLLTATGLLTNSFTYLAAGYGSSPSGSETFLRLIALQASQYNLSSYPLNASKNTISNIVSKINTYGIATAEIVGNNAFVILNATYSDHPQAYSSVMENFADMETAYDYHSFACKYSGSAAIYDYNASGNYIKALVSTNDSIFPTKAESTDGSTQLYSPVGEEVYIIPSNGNTLSRWMGFSSISSLAAQANVEETDASQKVQISSLLVGFSGAVKVKGVTANKTEMFVSGNASAVYDPYQSNTGLLGASKVSVDSASAAFIPNGAMVKVSNSLTSAILRPYRLLPSGTSITSSNTADIVTYFRSGQFVRYSKQGASIGRFAFYRNGMGLAQTEPMDNTGAISVTFSSVSEDLIKITTNTSDLSARVGDMMMIFGDVKKALVYAEQRGGSVVRYVLATGVKSDLWTGLNITTAGFTTLGFNTTSGVITSTGIYSGGIYNGYDYIEVSNSQAGSETPTLTTAPSITVLTTDLPFGAFPLIACKTPDVGYTNAQEYMGYPVVQVNSSREIIVIAPSIKQEIVNNGNAPITITLSPNLYPVHRKLMVFLSAVYNEKNIRSNRLEGSMFDASYNSGNVKVLVRKLPGDFVSIWASNSASEDTDTLKLAEMQVNTDDWLVCGNDFAIGNRGTFKIVAHNGRNQVIVYNPAGENQDITTLNGGTSDWLVGPFASDRPLRVLAAENIFTGDYIRITSSNSTGGSVSWVPNSLVGNFKIYSTGYASAANHDLPLVTYDSTLLCPTVDFVLTSAPASSDVNTALPFILGANASAITFQKASADFGYRYVAGRTVDPVDKTKGSLYLLPETNSLQMTSALGTKVSCLFKLAASESVVRGIDSYLTFSGLLRESHKIVDGNPSNIALYPGVRAAGTSIEILTPLVKSITVRLQIKPKDGVDSSIIAETVRATVAGYINKLSVGRPVVLSEIIKAVQSLPGVFSVTIIETKPASQGDRIVVGDVEKAIVFDTENDIIVS